MPIELHHSKKPSVHHQLKKEKKAMPAKSPKSKTASSAHPRTKKEPKPMRTKSSRSTVHHPSTHEEKRSTMPAHTATIESAAQPIVAPEATQPAPSAAPSPTGAPTAATTTAGATGGVAPQPTGPVAPPPADAKIPKPPEDYTPAVPGEFKTVVPRHRELTILSSALIDLSRFTDYDTAIGSTAPPLADIVQAFTSGSKWTAMCQATNAWSKYASLMQGLSWEVIRTQLDSLRPAFALAARRNPNLPEKYANLAKLLAVPAATAQIANATKKANKKAVAEGKPPTHGKVGKRAAKAAQKAALAKQTAEAGAPTPGATQAPTATPVQAPPASPAPAAQANGVAATAATPATTAPNGAGTGSH
jgi:hypothetical protein